MGWGVWGQKTILLVLMEDSWRGGVGGMGTEDNTFGADGGQLKGEGWGGGGVWGQKAMHLVLMVDS